MIKLDWDAVRAEIEDAGHGNKRQIVERYAKAHKVSVDTIYRQIRREQGKRKNRSAEKKYEDHLIDEIAKIKMKGIQMSLDERELATEIAIGMLQDQGVPGADQLTVSTVNRRLRERGFRIPDPRVRVEAEYANQEHQLDFSRSKYFQIRNYDPERDDYLLKVSGRELHYKQGDNRFRTWLCQVKDSYSRVRRIRAFGATGESALMGLEFLNWCYTGPTDNPMIFIPDRLKTDQGAFAKRKEVKAAMKALQIRSQLSTPGNKESQGKIESGFKSIWRRFELPLAIKLGAGATMWLAEYNELLHEFSIEEAKTQAHPVYRAMTREESYCRSIVSHPPRQIDADLLEIACRVEYRSVPSILAVQLGGEDYEAPSYAAGKRIRIYKNMMGELIGELLEEDRKPFVLKPYRIRQMDDFEHRPHATYRQQIAAQVRGETRSVNPNLPKVANLREVERARANRKQIFLPPTPKTVQPNSPFNNQGGGNSFKSVFEARLYIGNELRRLNVGYEEYADVFDPLLQKDLSRQSIDQVIGGIRDLFKNTGDAI